MISVQIRHSEREEKKMPGKKKSKTNSTAQTQRKRKQPSVNTKKPWKKFLVIAVVILVAVVIAFFLTVYFLYDKEPLEFKVKTIRIETAKDSYAAGNKLSEKSFSVYASDGNTEKLLDSEEYTVSPKSVPEHGHSVTVTVSSTDTKKISAEITVLIEREESCRYKMGRNNPDDVEGILYTNGDLEIVGTGSVRTYKSGALPWKDDTVQRLTWIDPNAEPESLDYWFSGNTDYIETLCRIPDTVKSMVETFKGCTSMQSMPDLSGAVGLEDITSCAEGCISLEESTELPGNIKLASRAFYGDTALIRGVDTSACVKLENMQAMYSGCTVLAEVQIPDSAKDISNICEGDVNLKTAEIPSSAEKMDSSFSGCVALETLEGDIPSSCTSLGNAFSGCKFLTGDLMVHCTSKTSLSSAFSGAATTGNGLNVNLSYDSGKWQETVNTGIYGTSKSASEILQSLKSSLEGSLSSGSHITVTINESEEETKE